MCRCILNLVTVHCFIHQCESVTVHFSSEQSLINETNMHILSDLWYLIVWILTVFWWTNRWPALWLHLSWFNICVPVACYSALINRRRAGWTAETGEEEVIFRRRKKKKLKLCSLQYMKWLWRRQSSHFRMAWNKRWRERGGTLDGGSDVEVIK